MVGLSKHYLLMALVIVYILELSACNAMKSDYSNDFLNNSLQIKPAQINGSGIIGETIEFPFEVKAKKNLTGLTFYFTNLNAEGKDGVFIKGESIQIKPTNLKSIPMGTDIGFYISISGESVNLPGKYHGLLEFSTEGSESESIPITLDIWEPERPLDIIPKESVLDGIIGSTPFRFDFTIKALDGPITDISFSPGNLMEVSGRAGIASNSVKIDPTPQKKIYTGDEQKFTVNISPISDSGIYHGAVEVRYKKASKDFQDIIPVSINALKFNAMPAKIILNSENIAFFGIRDSLLGPRIFPWSISLEDSSGIASTELLEKLANTTSFSLSVLTTSDSASTINPDKVCKKDDVKISSSVAGLLINGSFIDPSNSYGTYVGNITLRSSALGILAKFPVEIHVKPAGFIALIIILFGVLFSTGLDWWNNKGRRRNEIKGKIDEIESKMNSSEGKISDKARKDLENILEEATNFMNEDKYDKADEKIESAKQEYFKAVSYKNSIWEYVNDIRDVQDRLKDAKKKAKEIFGENPTVKLISDYIPEVEKKLEDLKDEIDRENKSFTDSVFKEKIDPLIKKVEDIYYIVDDYTELKDSVQKLTYGQDHFKNAISDLGENLQNINKETELSDVALKIKDINIKISNSRIVIGDLAKCHGKIETNKNDYDMIEATRLENECISNLNYGYIEEAKSCIQLIEKAIKEKKPIGKPTTGQAAKVLMSSVAAIANDEESSDQIELIKTPQMQQPERNEPRIKTIRLSLSGSQPYGTTISLTADIENKSKKLIYIFNHKHHGGNPTEQKCSEPSWEWKPAEKDKGMNDIYVDLEENGKKIDSSASISIEIRDPTTIERIQQNCTLNKLKMQFTGRNIWKSVSLLTYIAAIIVLTLLGYSQLYVNNPTFGSKDVIADYVYLFLWGFGVKAGTDVVAGIGSKMKA
jgi:hypothetical protein